MAENGSHGQYCTDSRRLTVEAECKCGAIAQVSGNVSRTRPAEPDAVMSPNYNRGTVLRHGFNRTAWIVIGVVAAIIVVASLYLYNNPDGDKSSAVRNESPQAELNR